MCTLAVFTNAWSDLPLFVAANRDEFYERPTFAPRHLGADGLAVGGCDAQAGGSWLAVGAHGLVVGVLNRRTDEGADPSKLSRGNLCVTLAECRDLEAALSILDQQDGLAYNPFNLLIADTRRAVVVQNRAQRLTRQVLDPGLHLLTNLDLNDPTCQRISKSTHRFAGLVPRYAETRDRSALVDGARAILADHQTALDDRKPTDQLCIHTPPYGTRSSSLVTLDDRGRITFLHAQGPPCCSTYRLVDLATRPATSDLARAHNLNS